MKTYLKIKIKYLAEEVRINKFEQTKWKKKAATGRVKGALARAEGNSAMVNSLREHAVHVIRPEIRDSNLAYAFIRGRSFASVEQTRYSDPNWENVLAIVKRFWSARYGALNSEDIDERFAMWKQAAPLRSVYVPRERSSEPRRHKPLSDYKAEKKMDLWVA